MCLELSPNLNKNQQRFDPFGRLSEAFLSLSSLPLGRTRLCKSLWREHTPIACFFWGKEHPGDCLFEIVADFMGFTRFS